MAWLLNQACSQNVVFVVWFTPGDIGTEAWEHTPPRRLLLRSLRQTVFTTREVLPARRSSGGLQQPADGCTG